MGNFNPKLPTRHTGTNKYITFFVARDRSPTSADYRQPETGTLYSVGTVWQVSKDPTTGTEGDLWMLSKIVANVGYWIQISSGVTPSGAVLTLSDTASTLVYPTVAGNIQIEGTAGQIDVTSVPGSNKLTLSLPGGGGAVDSFTVQAVTAPGVTPVTPTAAGVVTVSGAVVANHSVPLETRSRALNAYNMEVQYATTAAATDGTKSGVAHFDSARFSADASGFIGLNGSGVGQTLTAQSGGALNPTAGNWNISGLGETVTSGAVSTISIFSPRAYKNIVDATANNGTYQTITAALAGTASGDTIFIRPGTYVENVALTSSRRFIGPDSGEGSATIQGKVSDGGNVISVVFQNLVIKTNSDYCLSTTGAGSVMNLYGVHIRASNNTAIEVGSASASVYMDNCSGNIDTTGIAMWSSSGAIRMLNSRFDNSGLSTTASANSGNTFINNSYLTFPISCSGAGIITSRNSTLDTNDINAVSITTAGTGISKIANTSIQSGSGACMSIGIGTSAQVTNCDCRSSAANALTGLGTLFYANIAFTGATTTTNVSTQTALTIL